MTLVTLGGAALRVHPTDIRWNFKMKTSETRTMGGKVIQILGTTFSDITVTGTYGRGRRDLGDQEAWQSQIRFRKQVKEWAEQAVQAADPTPLKFTYPTRNWSFNVFVRSLSDIEYTVDDINPSWTLVLFPVDQGSTKIIRDIKDLYIKRLMDGVGWKQTAYNGPTQQEVDDALSPYGGSAHDYLQAQYADAFTGNSSVQAAGRPNTSGGGAL